MVNFPGVKEVAAIILAAGRSRRMGKFKPLLPFGDKTVIESCVTNLAAAGIDQIIIVIGHRADEVRLQFKNAAVTFVLNPNPDGEMSASIALGMGAIGETKRAVLITPVDHPAVPPEIIERILEAWGTGAKLVQPEFEGKGGHPVLIDLCYRNELTNLDPHTGLRGFFETHRAQVRRLPVESPFVARDIDTWDDYVRLHEAVFGRKPQENERSDN